MKKNDNLENVVLFLLTVILDNFFDKTFILNMFSFFLTKNIYLVLSTTVDTRSCTN